jgi:hypothetical protein
MINLQNFGISNNLVHYINAADYWSYPTQINKEINVIPAFDLLCGRYGRSFGEEEIIDEHGNIAVPGGARQVPQEFLDSVEYGAFRNKMKFRINNNVDLFYSYSKALKHAVGYAHKMHYQSLFNIFYKIGSRQIGSTVNHNVFRTNHNTKIVALPSIVLEVSPTGEVKILFAIVVKKEWMVDFLLRSYLREYHNLEINPNSIALLYDNSFDHKDYHYKGLRSKFRKEVKSVFEEQGGNLMGVDNMVSMFKKEVDLPSFIVNEQKEDWERQLVDDLFADINLEN